ncbi:MAG: carotenoid oxygenase family protein [Myxococcota bacterium]
MERALQTVKSEHTNVELSVIEGQVPPSLNGVLFRNGPGRLERRAVRYGHPFDGDGHVLRLAFDKGTVHYTNRFVRTPYFIQEEAFDRVCFRSFGTNRPGGWRANTLRLEVKNPANTNVVWHAGRLLALWEGGLPYALDPVTLATRGPVDFDGALVNHAADRVAQPVHPLTAHPRTCPATGELHAFGITFGMRSMLRIHRIGESGIEELRRLHLGSPSLVHDFGLTEHYWVFVLPRGRFDAPGFALGRKTPYQALTLFDDEPLTVMVVPRYGGTPIRLEAPPGFVFHIADAVEETDRRLSLDVVRYGAYPPLDDRDALYAGDKPGIVPRLERLVIDLVERRVHFELHSLYGAEFPVRHGSSILAVGQPPERTVHYFSGILRVDTTTGDVRFRELYPCHVGEPTIVAQAGDAAGYALTVVWNPEPMRAELWILRTDTLDTVARLALPHHVPPTFHGTWVDAHVMG